MRLLKKAAKSALHAAGGIRLFRAANSAKFRILMYHRFRGDTRELSWQCEHIRRYYKPIALRDVATALHSAGDLPANAVVITIDDGYADFYSHAWPIFRAYGMPATVYLVSDFLDRKLWLWTDQVRFLIERTPVPSFRNLPLRTAVGRSLAIATLYEELNLLPDNERLQRLAEMPRALSVELPAEPPPEDAPMSWEQVRMLAREGVEFGAHTRTHPILSRVESEAVLRDEIAGSKARIEQELQSPVMHFCYPNGALRDITDTVVRMVRNCGFFSAVTTEPGLNTAATNPHLLHRQGLDPWVAHDYFAEMLAGVRGHRARKR